MKVRVLIAAVLVCLMVSAVASASTDIVVGDSIILSVPAPASGWVVLPIEEDLIAPPLSTEFPALMLAPDSDMLDTSVFSRLQRGGSVSVPLEAETLLIAVSLLQSSSLPDATVVEMAQSWAESAVETSADIDALEVQEIDGRDAVLFDAVVNELPMRIALIEMGRAPGAAVNQFGLVVTVTAPDTNEDHTETILAIAGSVRVFDQRVLAPAMAPQAAASCAEIATNGGLPITLEDGRERLTAVLPADWAFSEATFSPVFPAIMAAPDESMINTEILQSSTAPDLDPGTVLMLVTLSDPRNTASGAPDDASAAEVAEVLAQDFQVFGPASVETALEINGRPAALVTVEAETFSLQYLLVEFGQDHVGQFSQFGVILTMTAPGEAAQHSETATAIAQTFCIFDSDVPRF
jgi:hypothetical protein